MRDKVAKVGHWWYKLSNGLINFANMAAEVSRFLLILLLIASACKGEKRYHDKGLDPEAVAGKGFLAATATYREGLNDLFRNPETSPLPDRYRKDFEGLEFYPPDSAFRVNASLSRTPDALPFTMPTTTGRVVEERLYGIVEFELKGRVFQLELYQSATDNPGEENTQLFLPFLDRTNGRGTYEGGRYLDLEVPLGETMVIDFNKAYNPYCAYNPKYSCPIVPKVNTLDIAIEAGVRAFKRKSPAR